MRYHLPFLTLGLLLCTLHAAGQTRRDARIVVDGVEREFIISIPSTSPPAGGWPLVFMFHGTTGDGEKFYNISGWKEKGAAENFVTVFPSSLAYRFYDDTAGTQIARVTKWNCGESLEKLVAGQTMKDDVRFVRAMVDTLRAMLPIDRSRTYGAGFSNGGVFVSKLAIDAGDIFAAVAPASGPMFPLDSARAPHPVGVLFSMGAVDPLLIQIVGRSLPMNDTGMAILGGFATRRYQGCLGLDTASTAIGTPLSYSRRWSTPLPGALPTELIVVIFANLEHIYPNGVNYPVAMANIAWEFFQRHRRVTTGVDVIAAPAAPVVYPQPARDHLVVAGEGDMELTIYSLLGRRMYSTHAARGRSVSLPELSSGVYRAEIRGNKSVTSRMISIVR